MVLLPIEADQPLNAARSKELRVARVLRTAEATPEQVREAVAAELVNADHRCAAERMRDEIASLDEQAHAVNLLERLATTRSPLLAGAR